MPFPRSNHVTVVDPVRNQLIIGGGRSLGQDGDSHETWSLSLGASPAWTWLGDGSLSGYYPAAILDAPGDRMVEYNGTADGVFSNDTQVLDLATNSMSGFAGGGLQSGALAFDSLRRRMIVLGNNDDAKVLDLATNVWSPMPITGSSGIGFRCAAYDGARDRVIAMFNSSTFYQVNLAGTPTLSPLPISGGPPPALNGQIVYDPARDRVEMLLTDGEVWAFSLAGTPQWSLLSTGTLPPGPRGTDALPVALDPAGDRLVFHGGTGFNDTWGFSLSTNTWSVIHPGSPIPLFVRAAGIVSPELNAMLLFGGLSSDLSTAPGYNVVWRFALDGASISPLATSGTAIGTCDQAAIRDPVRGRMLVFGGRDPGYVNVVQSLTLDATPTWSTVATAGTPPSPRDGCSVVYDPVRDRMVVFGGFDANSTFHDTWALTLSGTPTWTQLDDGSSLPSFGPPSAVYDSRHERLIVVGVPDQTRAWGLSLASPAGWVPLAGGAGIEARYVARAVYDSLYDRVLVGGGVSCTGVCVVGGLRSLQLSPSESWSTLGPAGSGPLARFGYTFVHDPVHGRYVMFGGKENTYGDEISSWFSPATWFLEDDALLGVPPTAPGDRSLRITAAQMAAPDRVRASFVLSVGGPATLDVLDLQGRRLGRWRAGAGASGPQEASVQLARAPAPGLCMLLLRQGDRSARRKLFVIR